MVDDFKGRGGSPWGTPPGGDGNGSGRGPRPPDIEELIRNFQNKINNILPGGSASGGKSIIIGIVIVAIIWVTSSSLMLGNKGRLSAFA